MLVCGQHFSAEMLHRINATVREDPAITRRALSIRVCSWLNWRASNGKLKDMSCRVALLKLHRRGLVGLPRGSGTKPFKGAKPAGGPLTKL